MQSFFYGYVQIIIYIVSQIRFFEIAASTVYVVGLFQYKTAALTVQ